jgi:hypothetical protein
MLYISLRYSVFAFGFDLDLLLELSEDFDDCVATIIMPDLTLFKFRYYKDFAGYLLPPVEASFYGHFSP